MAEFWRIALGIAGLGAIASFVVWSLYREWLRLDIFQRMTKDQQFKLFIIFMVFTFLFGICGLIVYVITTINSSNPKNAVSEAQRQSYVNFLNNHEARFATAI